MYKPHANWYVSHLTLDSHALKGRWTQEHTEKRMKWNLEEEKDRTIEAQDG